MLAHSPEFESSKTYRSVAEFVAALRGDMPDAVVVAASLYRSVEECAELNDIPVIGIQNSIMEPEALRTFQATATIYSSAEELHRLLHEAIESPSPKSYNESHELSERECDVLILVARGLTNKEIASELNISPHTVISHRKNIVHKTGIRSVAGLTVYAVLNKLIDSEQL